MQFPLFSLLLFCSFIVKIMAICTDLETPLDGDWDESLRNCKLASSEVPAKRPTLHHQFNPRSKCATMAGIAWLERPPLIYNEDSPTDPPQTELRARGIFPEVLNRAFKICCLRINQNETSVTYGPKNKTLSDLHKQILHGGADIILPVHSAEDDEYAGITDLQFVEVLKSPGVTLIMKKGDLESKESVLVRVLTDVWPIALFAVVLSAMSGIFLWALVSEWEVYVIIVRMCDKRVTFRLE